MPVTRLAPTVKSVPQAASVDSSRNGRVRIQEQLDPLPGQQLAPGPVPLLVPLPAARDDELELGLELADQGELRGAVGQVGAVAGIEAGGQDRHLFSPAPRGGRPPVLGSPVVGSPVVGSPVVGSAVVGGVPGPHHVLLDLAGGSPGQLVDDDHRLGDLESVQPVFSAAISSPASIVSPGLGTTNAVIASLQRSCGRPTTTTSATRGSAA